MEKRKNISYLFFFLKKERLPQFSVYIKTSQCLIASNWAVPEVGKMNNNDYNQNDLYYNNIVCSKFNLMKIFH